MPKGITDCHVSPGAIAVAPAAKAASSSDTFLLIAEHPNIGTADNGDSVEVTVDEGSWFDASPKSVSATGTFTHLDPDGNVLEAETWTADSLISFNFYGCRFIPALDVDLGDDDLCGGAVKMAVTLDAAHVLTSPRRRAGTARPGFRRTSSPGR